MEHAWCHDIARDAAVRAAEDGRDRPLPTLGEAIAAVTDCRPDQTKGDEMSQGMRTERITLEVTHDLDARLSDWIVEVIDESLGLMESVRVVDDCCLDRINMSEVIRQRDAAIRERDDLRVERITQSLTADRFAFAVAEADTLRARVAELESQMPLPPGPEGAKPELPTD